MSTRTYYYALVGRSGNASTSGSSTLVAGTASRHQHDRGVWVRIGKIEYGDLLRRGYIVRTNKGRNLKADRRERARYRRDYLERERRVVG